MRSIFGHVSNWHKALLNTWLLISLFYPAVAIFLAIKISPSSNFIKIATQICIVPCLLFIYYATPSEFADLEVENPVRKGKQTPIHLILFDMLSYEFLFADRKVKPVYYNFESFSDEADVYVNAFSPSERTSHSVVRMATGIDFEKIEYNFYRLMGQAKFSVEIKEISSFESLFSIASNSGYNVFLRAFALPYINNFGKHIQSGKVHPFDSPWLVGMHKLIWPLLSPGGIRHQKTTKAILNDYLSRICTNPRNTFFYSHWNVPHDPFIYDADGQMLGGIELTKNLITKPDRRLKYQHQLIGTDRILGKLIEALKKSGTYDESLIIVTSDHNIKGYDLNMKHVPLLIKKPYQKRSTMIESEVTTINLLNFIKNFIKKGECKISILQYSDGNLY